MTNPMINEQGPHQSEYDALNAEDPTHKAREQKVQEELETD